MNCPTLVTPGHLTKSVSDTAVRPGPRRPVGTRRSGGLAKLFDAVALGDDRVPRVAGGLLAGLPDREAEHRFTGEQQGAAPDRRRPAPPAPPGEHAGSGG